MYKIQPKTVFVGKSIKYLPTCHSTNDFCQQLAESNSIENGFCVYTDFQTSGRGQRGNIWEGEVGKNIMMSIFLKPDFMKAADQFQVNIAVSLGIYRAILLFIKEISNQKLQILFDNLKIKWPNDVYFEDNKIGGILIENTILGSNLSSSVIGIGLNVNQLVFENTKASSLKKVLGLVNDLEISQIMKLIFEQIECSYLQLKMGELEQLKNEYLNRLFRIHEWHYFRKNGYVFNGKIIGIDNYGRLEVETESDIDFFDFKEIEFVI